MLLSPLTGPLNDTLFTYMSSIIQRAASAAGQALFPQHVLSPFAHFGVSNTSEAKAAKARLQELQKQAAHLRQRGDYNALSDLYKQIAAEEVIAAGGTPLTEEQLQEAAKKREARLQVEAEEKAAAEKAAAEKAEEEALVAEFEAEIAAREAALGNAAPTSAAKEPSLESVQQELVKPSVPLSPAGAPLTPYISRSGTLSVGANVDVEPGSPDAFFATQYTRAVEEDSVDELIEVTGDHDNARAREVVEFDKILGQYDREAANLNLMGAMEMMDRFGGNTAPSTPAIDEVALQQFLGEDQSTKRPVIDHELLGRFYDPTGPLRDINPDDLVEDLSLGSFGEEDIDAALAGLEPMEPVAVPRAKTPSSRPPAPMGKPFAAFNPSLGISSSSHTTTPQQPRAKV